VLKELSAQLAKATGQEKLVPHVARRRGHLQEAKNLNPNVDFTPPRLNYMLGFDMVSSRLDLAPVQPRFRMDRARHRQHVDNRSSAPREYIGPPDRAWYRIDKRP